MSIEDLTGKVAVVTGGASGLGRAMGERFAAEGMKVVLADVEAPALDATVGDLCARGFDVIGVVTDVRHFADLERLRDRTLDTYGAVHVLCNNAGVGSGGEGKMWEHELNDWRWTLEVNVYGVIHGINAFVPLMVERGEEGHVVNTASDNGGIAPIVATPQYATSKAAVVTITECLYGQLLDAGSRVGASVLFPGPHMLRTRLFESWRNRPAELAKERPRRTPYVTLDEYERMMREAGAEIEYTPVEEVAGRVVDGIRANTFWMLAESERSDEKIRRRAESTLKRENPDYLRQVAGT